MKKGDIFSGYRVSCILRMPDMSNIVVVHVFDEQDLDSRNRNVFRVDKAGNVIWQITRLDHPGKNWVSLHQHARERGLPGCIEPFLRFYLIYADGSTNRDPHTGTPPDIAEWSPGCRVELSNLGIGTQWYSLDVDTGIATEITPKGFRPW